MARRAGPEADAEPTLMSTRAPSRTETQARTPTPRERRGLVLGSVLVAALTLALAGCTARPAAGTTTEPPPWPAPTELEARADAAGLRNVWGEKLAEHVHTHLSITDGGIAVEVPGNIGHSDRRRFAAQLHTHDASGIVHVESPTRDTFTLGQFFDEWGVGLTAWRVGGLRGEVTVWVDGHRYFGDPRSIPLRNLEEIDMAVTGVGEVPRRAPAFDWPPQYH